MFDNRIDFNETWLTEMPQMIGNFDSYPFLVHNIEDRIKNGGKVEILSSGLHAILGEQVQYYWYEENHIITLGVELYRKGQGLTINIVGKNPSYKGKPPYASDLYNEILNMNHKSIRIFSDTQLSDEGFKIWEKLLKLGHKISVYDRNNPGQTFQTFYSISELKSFIGNDKDYQRYQYVLSESGNCLAETRSFFNTRRYRELSGLL